MALSPDDLLTKRFEETRFRDGYDQEEVDDYLDEIATQWRELIAERDRLAAEVEQLKQGGAQPAAAEAPAAADEAQQSEAAQSAGLVEGSGAASNEFSPSADSSASLLAMAQRLHDEHVMSGEIRRDELISEAEGKRDLLISGAEANAQKINDDAQARKKQLAEEFEVTKGDLEQQRSDLQEKIDELKSFERDYRLRLRGYIESQLRDLDRTSSLGNVAEGDDTAADS
ncbi:DivIVA domain-containing protein [Agrococcus casei]|uniref:Cell wall synthesis protein Wag31 n=2 Tax=Agrococcus TaxID=46352 RepID=A0A1R4G537_9MICO|nr:DivIVA domain-containing protein [Agrococcus casei]SJM63360.1 Possibly a cell division protein, antigen 84 in Mycobacteria [Agrococcus casei LMG 22410]